MSERQPVPTTHVGQQRCRTSDPAVSSSLPAWRASHHFRQDRSERPGKEELDCRSKNCGPPFGQKVPVSNLGFRQAPAGKHCLPIRRGRRELMVVWRVRKSTADRSVSAASGGELSVCCRPSLSPFWALPPPPENCHSLGSHGRRSRGCMRNGSFYKCHREADCQQTAPGASRTPKCVMLLTDKAPDMLTDCQAFVKSDAGVRGWSPLRRHARSGTPGQVCSRGMPVCWPVPQSRFLRQ